ncbi:MAG: DUF6048 family protein [Flavobacteriaceae bacterium]|jgi:hypothetical protein|nr:DUF6048 family protein [Flavobacteriaceae bacterium]
MRHKHTLKYIISSILCITTTLSSAQETPLVIEKQTDLPAEKSTPEFPAVHPQRYGLRVGVDLFKLTRSFYDDIYQGFEVVGDYRVKKNMFAVAEIGHDKISRTQSTFGYTAKGGYARIGVDINLYENWLDREDMLYVGGRYGYSNFSQTLDWYKPYTTNPYFPSEKIDINKTYSGLSAHWLEFVTGIKTRVFSNVFMGFTLRINALITQKQPGDFENQYIPGFGKKHSGAIGVGFNYTVTYLIPFTTDKKKKEAKAKQVDPNLPSVDSNAEQAKELKLINENKKTIQ